jgi:hypothetical protein
VLKWTCAFEGALPGSLLRAGCRSGLQLERRRGPIHGAASSRVAGDRFANDDPAPVKPRLLAAFVYPVTQYPTIPGPPCWKGPQKESWHEIGAVSRIIFRLCVAG